MQERRADALTEYGPLANVGPGNVLTLGNRAILLEDGPATYEAMFAAIQHARDHINLETYILDDDAVGRRFAQALLDKQRQGIQVNVIHDSIGTIGTPSIFFQRLAENGIRVLEFNPINPLITRRGWKLNHRDHRKLLIVDGRIALLGGINISGVYSGGSFTAGSRAHAEQTTQWRDTDLQLEGPVVAQLQKFFLDSWRKQGGEPLAPKNYFPPLQPVGHDMACAISSSPDEPGSRIYANLLSAIENARSSVHLTNAYFVPEPRLLAALAGAARRGVDVTLILPSRTDAWIVFYAGRSYYGRLLRAGVKIFERRDVILHSKTALIDAVWATVGSANLDWRSVFHNDELNAVVLSADFGAQVQALFAKDLAASDRVRLEEWQQRPLNHRLKEIFARLWEYWL